MFAFAALSMEEAEYYSVTYKAKSDDIARQPTARYTLHDAEIAASKMSEAVTPITHIKCWDMSGKGAMIIYKTVAECNEWTLPKTPEFDVAMMSQTVFQAIWGSFSEDLSLLAWMTDCKKWFQRRQMGAIFAKAGRRGTTGVAQDDILQHACIIQHHTVNDRDK